MKRIMLRQLELARSDRQATLRKRRRISYAIPPSRSTSPEAQEESTADLWTVRTKTEDETADEADYPDFRIGIDYGTTFTCMAFSKRSERREDAGEEDPVHPVLNFPADPKPGVNNQVPTESCYLVSKSVVDQQTNRLPSSHPNPNTVSSKIVGPNSTVTTSSTNIKCGYEVQDLLRLPESDQERSIYETEIVVQRTKLLLDKSQQSKVWRAKLRDTIRQLEDKGIIREESDIFEELLTHFLGHCKAFLKEFHGYHDHNTVEVTFCVPVSWGCKEYANMAKYVSAALQRASFGVTNKQMPKLFMVNEAEVASIYALNTVYWGAKSGTNFLLVDCGGGTVDLGMYRIGREKPLRLEKELTKPTGTWTGSSDLNVSFREFILLQLDSERYLCENGQSLENIVDTDVMEQFENTDKRWFNILNKRQRFLYRIRNLRPNPSNSRIQKNALVISYDDMKAIFDESLDLIKKVVGDQVLLAHEKHITLHCVLLTGGFGDSPALQETLEKFIAEKNAKLGTKTNLIKSPPATGATAVAVGAVLRAQKKNHGPKRIPYQSFGILRTIEYDPASKQKHMQDKKQKRVISRFDGLEEIPDTIRWVIKAGAGPLGREHRTTFQSVHCFDYRLDLWRAREVLYTSDTCIEDNYQVDHPKNGGNCERLGTVEFDLTFLKDADVIKPKEMENGHWYYPITVMIEMIVVGRELKFQVRWPPEEDGTVLNKQKSFNIVAAFVPGTA